MPHAIEVTEYDLYPAEGLLAWGLASQDWETLCPGDWLHAPLLPGCPPPVSPRVYLTWRGWTVATGLPLPGNVARPDGTWASFDREEAELLRDLLERSGVGVG